MLAAAGHDVVGLDTFFYEGCEFGADQRSFEERRGDVRDVTAAELEGFDAIVHLAALSNDPLGDFDAELTYDINLRGTLHLAEKGEACGRRAVRLRLVLQHVRGRGGDDLLDQTAPCDPLTPYAESKVEAEKGLSQLADDTFSPVHLRNATAYGASPRLRVDIVLNNLAGWAFTTKKIKILSDGMPGGRSCMSATSVAPSLGVLAAPREQVHDLAVNVGATAENYRVRELARTRARRAAGVRGRDRRRVVRRSPQLPRRLFALPAATARLRGGVDSGRRSKGAGRCLSMNDLSYEEFNGYRYTRLKQIRRLLEEGRLDDSLRWKARGR